VDIEINYTGLRVGEKLYEELLIGDNVSKTDNPLIKCVQEELLEWAELSGAIDSFDHETLRKLLI
jgi:UDP-N-acetylglucosamine 4,6-dehydratase